MLAVKNVIEVKWAPHAEPTALCLPVTAAAAPAAECTHLSFDGDDASVHECGVSDL